MHFRNLLVPGVRVRPIRFRSHPGEHSVRQYTAYLRVRSRVCGHLVIPALVTDVILTDISSVRNKMIVEQN